MMRSLLAVGFLLVLIAPAGAQTQTDSEVAFSVERFVPAPGPGTFLVTEDAEVLPHLQWSLGVGASLMSKPLVFENLNTGIQDTVPVKTRLGFDVLAAVGLGSRFQLGIALPLIAAQDGDRLRDTDLDDSSLDPIALGDVRLHGKARFMGTSDGNGGAAGVSFVIGVPTGNQAHFAGEKGFTFETRLLGSYRRPRWAIAANLGSRIRAKETVLLSPSRPHGNELVGSFAAEAVIPLLPLDHLSGLLEYSFVRGDSGASDRVRGPSPQEARLGARWRYARGTTLTAALGWGLSPDEVGSPRWRVIMMARFDTNRQSGDLDRDGISDRVDRCPHQREDRDGFEDLDGCPDLDNDGDRIPDTEDKCPNRAEVYNRHEDLDGCPDTILPR